MSDHGETNYVYVFAKKGHDGKMTGPVKVGMSKNVYKRLKNIQTSSPFPVEIAYMFAVPNNGVARDVERAFHETQREKRAHGEWFDYEPVQAIHLLCLCMRAMLDQFLTDKSLIEPALEMSGVLKAEKLFNLELPRKVH